MSGPDVVLGLLVLLVAALGVFALAKLIQHRRNGARFPHMPIARRYDLPGAGASSGRYPNTTHRVVYDLDLGHPVLEVYDAARDAWYDAPVQPESFAAVRPPVAGMWTRVKIGETSQVLS